MALNSYSHQKSNITVNCVNEQRRGKLNKKKNRNQNFKKKFQKVKRGTGIVSNVLSKRWNLNGWMEESIKFLLHSVRYV